MSHLKPKSVYKETKTACNIADTNKEKSTLPESVESRRERLGAPALIPLIADQGAGLRNAAMAHKHFDLEERTELELALRCGQTQASVARQLGRSAGAISAEIKRNGGREHYRACIAHHGAVSRQGASRRGNAVPLSENDRGIRCGFAVGC